jgi:hypothetical protein
LIGALSLLLLSGILMLTAKSWSKWLFAILAYCAVNLLFGVWLLAFGTKPRMDLNTAFVAILVLSTSALATAKFVKHVPIGAERPGLVMFLICLIFAIEYQSWEPWIAGLTILAAGHTIHFIMHRWKYSHLPKHSTPA